MTENAQIYLDTLVKKVKEMGEFPDTVFYRSYDGLPLPSEQEGYSVCAGVSSITAERRYLSLYRDHRLASVSAELEFKISAADGAHGLTALCGRLESLLRKADPDGVIQTKTSELKYDEDMNAVFRTVTALCRFYPRAV